MDSTSSNHQQEVKSDEIAIDENKENNNTDNTNLEEDTKIVDNNNLVQVTSTHEENKDSQENIEKPEEIANSIANGLLCSSTDNENMDNNDKNSGNNEEQNSEYNEDKNKNDDNTEQNYENVDSKNDDSKIDNNESQNKQEEEDNSNNNESPVLQFSQNFSDEDVQYAFDQMLENGKLPDASMFPQLLQRIYREKTDAIDNQDYDRAKKLENMISSINRENDNFALSYTVTPESQTRYLEERDSRLHQQLENTKAKYKVKLDNHTENCESRLRQLQEQQQLEIDELRTKYQDPSFLARFKRPSPQLLNLRRCERKLALAKKYEEARQIKRIADNKQREEEKEMQEAAQQSMQSEYIKLIDKQKKEMDRLIQFDKKMEKEIKTAKHKEMTPIERAIKQTAIRKANNEAKKPFYSLSSSAPSPFSISMGAKNYNPELAKDVMAKNQTLATPRTMSKIKMLKIRNKVELNVEPIDNSTFAKLEQMNARRMKSLLPKL